MVTTITDQRFDSESGTRSVPLKRFSGNRLTSTAAILALLFPLAGTAAEWRIAPTVTARQSYTDNVGLAASGSEKSDFITDLSPGISVTADGPRLKLRANYALQYLHYAHGNKNDTTFHKLNADTNIELVKNLFAVDGTASINQQNTSLVGPQAVDNYAITDNRTTVRTFSVSPYLHHEFRGMATSELRFTHNAATSSTASLSSTHSNGLHLSVSSIPSVSTLGWGFDYSIQKESLSNANAVRSSTASIQLRYPVTSQFSLTSATGYDKYDYAVATGAPDPHGRFYSGGFAWRPTERTSLSASVGDKFYGRTYSLDSSIRSRASVWRVSYDENVTTALSQLTVNATDSTANLLNQLFRSSIPDDVARQQTVDRIILSTTHSINYLTNQIFLQKALRASVALTGAKNTVVFTASHVSRQPQSAQNALTTTALGDTRQVGLNALWSWRVTALTRATFSADLAKSKTGFNNTEERLKTFRMGLACRLQPKLDGVIEVRHTGQTSNAPGNGYQENAVSAFVSMRF